MKLHRLHRHLCVWASLYLNVCRHLSPRLAKHTSSSFQDWPVILSLTKNVPDYLGWASSDVHHTWTHPSALPSVPPSCPSGTQTHPGAVLSLLPTPHYSLCRFTILYHSSAHILPTFCILPSLNPPLVCTPPILSPQSAECPSLQFVPLPRLYPSRLLTSWWYPPNPSPHKPVFLPAWSPPVWMHPSLQRSPHSLTSSPLPESPSLCSLWQGEF